MATSLYCALAATLAGCAAPSDLAVIAPEIQTGKADQYGPTLRELDHYKLGIDEPSDLAYADGVLYTVSDSHAKIYAIDPGTGKHDSLDIKGNDLEAIAIDGPDWLIADETNAKIWRVDREGNRHDPIEIEEADDGNSGIEGLAILPGHRLLIAKEKHPARLIEIGEDLAKTFDQKIHWASDLSALTYNPLDGHVWALSDEDHTLYRLDAAYDIELAWKLPIKNPEGVAFAGDLVYICSDAEAKLYVFQVD